MEEFNPVEIPAPSSAKRRLATGAVWSAASTLVTTLAGFPLTVVLVRLMSTGEFGALAYGTSVLALLASIAGLGLATGVSRMGAFEMQRGGPPAFSRVVRAATKVSLWAGSLVLGAAVTLGVVLARTGVGSDPVGTVILVMAPVAAIAPLRGSLIGALRALHRPRTVEGTTMITAVFALALSVGLLLIGRRSATEIAAARTLANTASLAILVPATWVYLRGGQRLGSDHVKALLNFSIPVLLASVMWQVVSQLDIALVGAFLGNVQAGLYAPVSRMVEWGPMLFGLVGSYLIPVLATSLGTEQRASFEATYRIASRWGLVCASPILGVTIVVPASALALLYGPGHEGLEAVTRILSFGAIVHVSLGFNGAALIAFGRSRDLAIRSGIALAIDAACCVVLIPRFGLPGAAFATAITLVSVNAMNSGMLLRRYRIRPWDSSMSWTALTGITGIILAFPATSIAEGNLQRCIIAGVLAGGSALVGAIVPGPRTEIAALLAYVRRDGRS